MIEMNLRFFIAEKMMTIIQALDNTSIGGKTVQMNLARGNQGKKEDAKEGCKLFVHGVKQEIKEEALKVELSTKFCEK